MPRRNSPSRRGGARQDPGRQRAASSGGAQASGSFGEQQQSWRGREFRVRAVSGSAQSSSPERSYRCPGCDQLLAAGIAHVVVWPAEDLEAADRRHWHSACWAARDRRAPGVQRSRNAPRYG